MFLIPYFALTLSVFAAYAVGRYFPAETSMVSRIGYLDGLRGYLALGVLFSHFPIVYHYASSGNWEGSKYILINKLGQSGVTCFFMITSLLFYQKLCIGAKNINWRNFFIGRIFRIYPMYTLAIIGILLVANITSAPHTDQNTSSTLSDLFLWMTFSDSPAIGIAGYRNAYVLIAGVNWTLRYEVLFYISLPVFSFMLNRINNRYIRVPLLAVFFSGSYLFRNIQGHAVTDAIQAFTIGCLIAEARNAGLLEIAFLRSKIVAILCLSLMIIVLCYPVPRILYTFGIANLLLCVVAGNTMLGTLSRRGSQVLGDASYSIYLIHGLIMHLIMTQIKASNLDDNYEAWLLMPIAAAFTSFLALLAYRYIEVPGIQAGRSFAGWRSSRLSPTDNIAP